MTGFVDFPYHFDGLGLTAATPLADHVRDLIDQVLFTSPGERVMRPDFGSGILELVFEPNSTALAGTTQMLIQGALHQYLSHLISVQGVEVENVESSLLITVRYVLLSDRSAQQASFTVPGVGP